MTNRSLPRGRTLFCAALTALSLAACGDGKKGDASSSAEPGGSAAAKTPAAKGDPAIVAELKKLSACKRDEGYRESDCEAAKAWDTYVEKFLEEDDMQLTKQKKLVTACVEGIGEKDDTVREAAYECLSNHTDGIADVKSVLGTAIADVAKETSPGVQTAMFAAIRQMDPSKHGYAAKLVELAKPMVDQKSGTGNLSRIVGTLMPRSGGEPTPEAVGFALELLEKGKAQGDAIDVLVRTKTKTKEACDAFIKLAETKKSPWGRALDGMHLIEGHCKEHAGRVVEVIVAKAAEADGYDKGFIGADVVYFQRLVETKVFDDAQRAKLRTAVEGALKNATKDHQKESYEKLIAALK